MQLRTLLVAIVVIATAAFVVGVSTERDHESGHYHEAGTVESHGHGEAGRSAEDQGAEVRELGHAEPETERTESDEEELRPLGVDIEAWPFVVLAGLVSLALAGASWLRPRLLALLALTALVMVAFAALDVREVFHQSDIDETGLAVLAGAVAALHVAAAAVAGLMAGAAIDARRPAG
jgi:hypothetical protein